MYDERKPCDADKRDTAAVRNQSPDRSARKCRDKVDNIRTHIARRCDSDEEQRIARSETVSEQAAEAIEYPSINSIAPRMQILTAEYIAASRKPYLSTPIVIVPTANAASHRTSILRVRISLRIIAAIGRSGRRYGNTAVIRQSFTVSRNSFRSSISQTLNTPSPSKSVIDVAVARKPCSVASTISIT